MTQEIISIRAKDRKYRRFENRSFCAYFCCECRWYLIKLQGRKLNCDAPNFFGTIKILHVYLKSVVLKTHEFVG